MSIIPAYPIQGSTMRPVTKITILGLRLGVVALAVYWAVIFLGTHLPAAVSITPGQHIQYQFKVFKTQIAIGITCPQLSV